MKAQLRKAIPAMLALFTLNAAAVTRYVDLNSPIPTPPYTNWPTAATNIQKAVDVADPGDQILVTNGVYEAGGQVVFGTMTNRVAITKAVTVQSVNGAAVTIVKGGAPNGDSAVRCIYLTNAAILAGFTLMNGHTRTTGDSVNERMGGGAWCGTGAIITNCLFLSNSASAGGGAVFGGNLYSCSLASNECGFSSGGGAYQSVLSNCAVFGNSAGNGGGAALSTLYLCGLTNNRGRGGEGGGAYQSTLSNCTVSGNWAYNDGGGVSRSTNYSCVLSSNSTFYADYGGASLSTLYNCAIVRNAGGTRSSTLYNCTVVSNYSGLGVGGGVAYNSIVYFNSENWSFATGSRFTNCCTTPLPAGSGNFTYAPIFVNQTLQLQSNSPCVNDGRNAYVSGETDAAGNPRVVGGTVDVGAYENQNPASLIPHLWLLGYNLPTDGSADWVDTDVDGMSNWGEWRSGTVPTNALSVFRIVAFTNVASGVRVTWNTFIGRQYFLERATNFNDLPPFRPIATNIPGVPVSKTFTDTTATNGGPYFYRVGLQ